MVLRPSEVDDRNRIGVGEVADEFRFALKPDQPGVFDVFREVEQFERNWAFEVELRSVVHGAETAARNRSFDAVFSADDGAWFNKFGHKKKLSEVPHKRL